MKEIFKLDNKMALNDVIRNARLKINLKQEDAANTVNVTVQTYSKWENGKTEPKASQIAKLSEILSISTDEICKGKENSKLELIEFMKMVSEISRGTSDFELKMAIWESIDDDNRFINNLRKHSSIPDRYLVAEQKPDLEEILYEAEKEKTPDFQNEKLEMLKDQRSHLEEEEFVNGLDGQSRVAYEKIKIKV